MDLGNDILALSESEVEQEVERRVLETKKRASKSATRDSSRKKRPGRATSSNQAKRVRSHSNDVTSDEEAPLKVKDILAIVKAVLEAMPGSSTSESDSLHPEETRVICIVCCSF